MNRAPRNPQLDLTNPVETRTFLERVVAIPSPSGGEQAVVEAFVETLAPFVSRAEVDAAGNAVAEIGSGERELLLLAHLDTAPGHPPVHRSGDLLYGRGSVDAKGSAVAFAAAMARIAGGLDPSWRVRFVGAVGEESPGSPGASYLAATSPEPALLMVGEPSGVDAFTLGYKGQATLRLVVEQSAAHSAADRPSANDQLVAAISELQAWREAHHHGLADTLFERLQLTTLRLASQHDGLSDRAEATLSWRLPPAWPPERLLQALAKRPWGACGWALEGGVAAVRAPRDGELARAFRLAIRAQGMVPRPKLKTGTSDWNVVAQRWSTPAVAYGPGDAALDHTPHEHLDLSELDRSIEVLVAVMRACCGPQTGA